MIILAVIIIILYITISTKSKYKNSSKDTIGNRFNVKNNYTGKGNAAQPLNNTMNFQTNTQSPRKNIMEQIEKGIRDDRTGDWLARQLIEEKRSLVMMNIMFQLKGNRDNASAGMLKEMHEKNCDASKIDTGST